MNKNLILGLIVIAFLVIGGAFLFKSSPSTKNKSSSVQNPAQTATTSPTKGIVEKETTQSDGISQVKEFTITGSPFKFDLKTITVKKGQKVRIVFKNAQGTHDFVLDEFGVKTPVIKAGDEATVEFVAEKAGNFEYYCSVGNHRTMGMKGTLVVEE